MENMVEMFSLALLLLFILNLTFLFGFVDQSLHSSISRPRHPIGCSEVHTGVKKIIIPRRMIQMLVSAMFIVLWGIWKYGGKPLVFTHFTQGRTVAMAIAVLPTGMINVGG